MSTYIKICTRKRSIELREREREIKKIGSLSAASTELAVMKYVLYIVYIYIYMGRTEVKAEQEDLSVWQRKGNERSAQDCRTLYNIEKHKQK